MQNTRGRDYITSREEVCSTCKEPIKPGDPCREITTQTGHKRKIKYFHLNEKQCRFVQPPLNRKSSQIPKKKKTPKKSIRFI